MFSGCLSLCLPVVMGFLCQNAADVVQIGSCMRIKCDSEGACVVMLSSVDMNGHGVTLGASLICCVCFCYH